MNRQEADQILQCELDAIEQFGYEELRGRIDEVVTLEKTATTGTIYQLELQIFWDDRQAGPIRILGSIDDGGLRALMPHTASRIVSPP
jgi:hypothetical protein